MKRALCLTSPVQHFTYKFSLQKILCFFSPIFSRLACFSTLELFTIPTKSFPIYGKRINRNLCFNPSFKVLLNKSVYLDFFLNSEVQKKPKQMNIMQFNHLITQTQLTEHWPSHEKITPAVPLLHLHYHQMQPSGKCRNSTFATLYNIILYL